MSKKTFLILFIVMVVSLSAAIIYTNKDKINSYGNKEAGSNIAIMVYDEEVGGYVKQDTVPKGRYMLNKDKSLCIAGNNIGSYDAINGTISYSFTTSDDCYLYFEEIISAQIASLKLRENGFGTLTYTIDLDKKAGSTIKYIVLIDIAGNIGEDGGPVTYPDNYTEIANYITTNTTIENKKNIIGSENACVKVKVIIADIYDNVLDEQVSAKFMTSCFIAGTKVLTEDSYKNIEDIKIGDYVYSYNFDNNLKELQEVTNTIISSSNLIYRVTVNDKTIEMSDRHQLYIIDKGWVRAYDVRVGDKMLDTNNQEVEITKIDEIYYENPITTYNLTVEGNHNYFVSDSQVLVHNASHYIPEYNCGYGVSGAASGTGGTIIGGIIGGDAGDILEP